MEKTETIKKNLLKVLKEDLSETALKVLTEMDAERLMLTVAVLRELLPLVEPDRLKEIARSRNNEQLVKKAVKLRNEIVSVEGILRTERRLVLSAVTRYFSSLEKEISRRGAVPIRLTQNFFGELCRSVERVIEQLQDRIESGKGEKPGKSS